MKRDKDLLREIMIEARNLAPGAYLGPGFRGMNPYVIEEHIRQLEELGFVETTFTQSPVSGHLILRLTSAGHDFVEDALDSTVWGKVMEKGRDASWTLFLELLKEGARSAAKGMF